MSKALPEWMDPQDKSFLTFIRDKRWMGYGRMMQIISEEWYRVYGGSAHTCGPCYSTMEQRRERCAAEGHDWSEGNEYKWCDRCGHGESK